MIHQNLQDSADGTTDYMDGAERLHQREAIHLDLYLRVEAHESAQAVSGEPRRGVGSESCDQETGAWNPRYASMNYALARLARAG